MFFTDHALPLYSFADALNYALNAGYITSAQICACVPCSDSTFGRWRNEESEPKFGQVMQIIRCPDVDIRFKLMLLSVLTATTQIKTTKVEVRDFDGDGKIDEFDALGATAKAIDELGTTLHQLYKKTRPKLGAACALSPADALNFQPQYQSIAMLCLEALCVIEQVASKSTRRGGR